MNRKKKMLPLQKFSEVLRTYQAQMIEDTNEIIAAADLIGSRPNYLVVDEHGFYHLQVSGTIDEVIAGITANLERVKRIKSQRDK